MTPNKRITSICASALACLALFGPATGLAHHSAVAFDQERVTSVTGTVTRFVWRNPHLVLNVEVENESGRKETWRIEGPSATISNQTTLNKESIREGDRVTVEVHPLKSGRPGGLLQMVTLADGTVHKIGERYQTGPRQFSQRILPSLVEYEPPPDGETWQERERKTRPAQLPMIGNDPRQTGPGALDPEHLAKDWPEPAFDLTGTWAFRGEIDYTANYGGYEFKPHPQFTAKGQRLYDEYLRAVRDGTPHAEPTARCYPAGLPRIMTRYLSLMMLQYPTAIFMVSRLNNEYRVIWLDGREREPDAARDWNWNGESLGRWEGDTLVVETTGFTDENHLIQQGVFTGNQLKIIERYRLINDGNTLVMEFIMTDPEHWVGEWRHTKFRDRILRADVREATCLPDENALLPGIRP